jgi:hypothetical protein
MLHLLGKYKLKATNIDTCQTEAGVRCQKYLSTSTMSIPLGIHKTEEIAAYLKARFLAELHREIKSFPLPNLSLDLQEDCNYAAKVLVQAAENQSKSDFLSSFGRRQYDNRLVWMTWSVDDYLEVLKTGGKEVEETLLRMFPPKNSEMIDRPCVIVDRDGKILLWYLPRLIGPGRRVGIFGGRLYSRLNLSNRI